MKRHIVLLLASVFMLGMSLPAHAGGWHWGRHRGCCGCHRCCNSCGCNSCGCHRSCGCNSCGGGYGCGGGMMAAPEKCGMKSEAAPSTTTQMAGTTAPTLTADEAKTFGYAGAETPTAVADEHADAAQIPDNK